MSRLTIMALLLVQCILTRGTCFESVPGIILVKDKGDKCCDMPYVH